MIYFWSFLASILAVGQEALFVRYSYAALLPWVLISAVALNYLVYRVINSAETLVAAFLCFSLFNLAARTGITLVLGQSISKGTWIALGLMSLAVLAREVVH